MSQTNSVLDKAWKSTCKVVLGQEIGNLDEYKDWLSELMDKNTTNKSSISGKDVAFCIKEYAPDSKWISFDEIDYNKKLEPLNINEIKDIDSIVQAVSDRAYYCGNITLGNSKEVEGSSNISDGFCVRECAQFFNVKNIAYSTVGRENSYCFGTHGPGGSEFLIRCSQTVSVKRSFELYVSTNSADCYYVYGLDDCSNCLFSFNLRNKRNCIGNLELEKSKFDSIKAKLLADVVDELKSKKRAPSLLEIIGKSRPQKPVQMKTNANSINSIPRTDKQVIEKEFSDTTRILFGKQLNDIDNYSNWLTEHTHKLQEAKSALSGEQMIWQPYGVSMLHIPEDRMITLEESQELENMKISAQESENMRLKNAHESIGKIAFLKVDLKYGNNSNMIESTYYVDCSNCYKFSMTVGTKYCAFGMWAFKSSNCFGVDSNLYSDFCLKCYHSTKLTRCFEMDNCRDCSDSMFCHNCESLSNCMFCFNVKAKRYAIGNVEVGKENYEKIKKIVLDEITKKLEKDRKIDVGIYNIGVK